ncbi:ras association domain-containing protein 10-like [Amphibalanus amphitrite]|uniref:ras association domain-containing protein 10-like n=1 Tax=Amphibalanus amphitrite TaxID=1232801 RepID=UPI001C913BB2|nr:ras association domain-containing protein 10-like [Amphibalanus amphitrite]
MTMTSEIPVWVDGVEKWVTGVGRRTTCADLVRALLSAEAGSEPPTESELRAYSLVERWRQVERPLDPAARIQKVWRTWGEDTAEVRFALKRLGPQTPKEVKAPRRRQRHRWRSSSSLEAVHPRKLTAATDHDSARDDVVERLMQTILVQGETIAAQLRRLHEREDLIGYYEHKMHRMREDRLGSDYLLRTYLRDGEPAEAEKASHDSGVGAELGADAPESPRRDVSEEEAVSDLRQTLMYLERIVELNSRIAEQEEAAVRLTQRVRRAAAPTAPEDTSQTVLELEISRAELQRLMAVCARQTAEIEQNERALMACEHALEDKRRFARYLECELDEMEADERRLLADGQRLLEDERRRLADEQTLTVEQRTPPADQPRLAVSQRSDHHAPAGYANPVYTNLPPPGGTKELADGDSNSDTGLSSLHSSSDEAAVGYVLDTLV